MVSTFITSAEKAVMTGLRPSYRSQLMRAAYWHVGCRLATWAVKRPPQRVQNNDPAMGRRIMKSIRQQFTGIRFIAFELAANCRTRKWPRTTRSRVNNMEIKAHV